MRRLRVPARMTCREPLSAEDPLRFVGDPVDVVTGAVIDRTVDAQLDAPFPFRFVRYYSSELAAVDRGLGWGHTHSFDHYLSTSYDNGIGYTGPDGRQVAFPLLWNDGERSAKAGYVLERVSVSLFRLHLPDDDEVLEFEFSRPDWPARLTAISHPSGTIRLYYDAQTGLLSSIADSLNRTIRVDWVQIVAPSGHAEPRPHIAALVFVAASPSDRSGAAETLIAYRYDAFGRLLGGTDRYNNSFGFEYDANTRLIRLVDRRGYSFHFKYDARGRCIHTAGDDGVEEVELEYLEDATLVTLADRGQWVYEHAEGFLSRILDPYGGEHRRELDEAGQLREETDAAGRTFSIVRDANGKGLGRRDSAGHVWPMGQEPPKAPAHYVPSNDRGWEYGAILPSEHGLPVRRDLEMRGVPRLVLDVLAPSKGSTFADLQQTWAETTVRDLGGLPLWVERADGSRSSFSYDANANRVRLTDFDGSTWRWAHVSWNHTQQIINPLGHVTELEHTRREKLSRVVDPGSSTSEYSWDLKNRLVGVSRDGVVRETYSYGADDELEEKFDGEGAWLLRFEREDEGRKVRLALASGETHHLVYTAARRLKSAIIESLDGKQDLYAFDYNLAGDRIRDERNGRGVQRYFRDGRLATMRVLERFTTRYAWIGNDRLDVVDPTGAKHRIQHCYGGVVQRTTSNRVTEVAQFHPHGYCLAKIAFEAHDRRWDRFYERSGEGDVLSIRDSARGIRRFSYDAAHRLIGETLPNGHARTFVQTLGGNLAEAPGLGGVTVEHNRLVNANGSRFEYSQRHHMSARHSPQGSVHYRRDARDQMVLVHGGGVGVWSARYDALGRRIETIHNGATTTFYWDTDRLAAEIQPDGRLRIYVYVDDVAMAPFMFVDYANVDADPKSGKRYFILANHLGAPELVQDDARQVVWRAWYEAYGTAHIEVGHDFHQPLRWPGHYFDAATGLQYARYRYYSPELGRWIESDPLGVAGGLNLHAYGEGNPLRNVDVQGLDCPPGEKTPDKPEGKPDAEKTPVKPLDVGTYRDLKKREVVGDELEHDHMPSSRAVAEKMNRQLMEERGYPMTKDEKDNLHNNLMTVEVEKDVHKEGPTYLGKNRAKDDEGNKLYENDANDLRAAADRDAAAARENLIAKGHDPDAVDAAIDKLHTENERIGVYKDKLPLELLDDPP
ncbi:DUF6531 domain-containing protein [Pendulispora rubella]|uniref:DUF6531 domain-containing protein n=1 Tax=Pendulispora rubella TaxID=2741070 RepID=A0ABZ2LIN8_9BACT